MNSKFTHIGTPTSTYGYGYGDYYSNFPIDRAETLVDQVRSLITQSGQAHSRISSELFMEAINVTRQLLKLRNKLNAIISDQNLNRRAPDIVSKARDLQSRVGGLLDAAPNNVIQIAKQNL